MSLSSLLDQKLTLQRAAITQDASGGTTRTFANILADIPCLPEPAAASVIADYARRDMLVNYTVYTTADLDSLITGGVKINDRLTDGGPVYYVIKTSRKNANSQISNEVLYQLDCEKISA
jgi:hypothetical protein